MGGEITSPNAWMIKMLIAKALARTAGGVTLARMVLEGPVLERSVPLLQRVSERSWKVEVKLRESEYQPTWNQL